MLYFGFMNKINKVGNYNVVKSEFECMRLCIVFMKYCIFNFCF